MEQLSEYQWLASAFGIMLLTGAARLGSKLFLDRAVKRSEQTRTVWDDAFVDALRRPLNLGVWIIGISLAIEVIGQEEQAEIFKLTAELRDVAIVWLLIWFLLRLISNVERDVVQGKHSSNIDPTTASAIGKLLRATILITGSLMILQAFGFSISGVLAFGGIGGIAIGFAARDLLANFFGALMIFLDRPFSVGDWVRSPDRDIEGTVEDIGWRMTRIRTFDARPLYVPNSVFNSLALENPSRMTNRRIYETVGLRYDDVDKLPIIVEKVKAMLVGHPEIDGGKTLMVNFVSFGPSAIEFFIYCFTRTTVWTEYHEVKQDVLFKVADIVANHGAEIAFPTQTLLMQMEPADLTNPLERSS